MQASALSDIFSTLNGLSSTKNTATAGVKSVLAKAEEKAYHTTSGLDSIEWSDHAKELLAKLYAEKTGDSAVQSTTTAGTGTAATGNTAADATSASSAASAGTAASSTAAAQGTGAAASGTTAAADSAEKGDADATGKTQAELDSLYAQAESANEQAKAQADAMEVQIKCMRITANLISGKQVPGKDVQYLLENDSKSYGKAMSLRAVTQSRNEMAKQVTTDEDFEDKTATDNGTASADPSSEETAASKADIQGMVQSMQSDLAGSRLSTLLGSL